MKELEFNNRKIKKIVGVKGYFYVIYEYEAEKYINRLIDFCNNDREHADKIVSYYKDNITFYRSENNNE